MVFVKVYAYAEVFQVLHGKAEAKKMQKSILEHAAVTVPIKEYSSVPDLNLFFGYGDN